MNTLQTSKYNFETLTWGALLMWWGITELVKNLPDGAGAIGVALILLGINAVRLLNGLPVNGFSATIGVLAALWGGLTLAGTVLNLPFDLPIFAILLITLGVILLGREILRSRD